MPKIRIRRTIILSLGGSLIVPDSIDIGFLKSFKAVIEKFIKKGHKFVIICGGGKLARNMQNAASQIMKADEQDLDWLGIYATRLNAQLIKTIFKSNAEDFVILNPNKKISFKKNKKSIAIAAGWLPGWSTDYDAVIIAKKLGIKEVINMSNIDYVYDKDPKKYSSAKKAEKISWKDFSRLISQKWRAGMHTPFDPIAAKEAEVSGIKAVIIGKDLKNLENLLEGKNFKGTVIE